MTGYEIIAAIGIILIAGAVSYLVLQIARDASRP